MSDARTWGSPEASWSPRWVPKMTAFGTVPEDEPVHSVPPGARMIGVLGTFQVLKVLSGGMGEVSLCIEENDPQRRLLALKSFKRRFQFNRSTRRAFERECALWAAASLSPGVFPIYGIEYVEDRPFIVMPGVPAGPRGERSLRDLLDS